MTTTTTIWPEQTVILRNVSWETYERLLEENDGNSGAHFSFDEGELEIRILSTEHERLKQTIATLVELLALELEVNVDGVGSTTFRRKDVSKGFEGDACFYIQNAAAVAGKKRIDLSSDPPPDLVIEIDITHQSLNKFGIFAKLGIPEVWHYDGAQLRIFNLEANEYLEREISSILPPLNSEGLNELIAASQTLKRIEWARQVRQWAQTQKAKN